MTSIAVNSPSEIYRRKNEGLINWSGPTLMLFARSTFSFLAQGLIAGIYRFKSSPRPWRSAAKWLPVYATLIDVGCLVMLQTLTRRENMKPFDLLSFERRRWRSDFVLGLALIPVSLIFIFGGIAISRLIVYGKDEPPAVFRSLPLLPAVYAAFVFPLLWGLTEQMTYNGYLAPRIEALSGKRISVALVSFAWSFQHVLQPLTFDPKFMLYRLLAPIPFSIFDTLLYLRIQRLFPFVVAHVLMDGADAFAETLMPRLRQENAGNSNQESSSTPAPI